MIGSGGIVMMNGANHSSDVASSSGDATLYLSIVFVFIIFFIGFALMSINWECFDDYE